MNDINLVNPGEYVIQDETVYVVADTINNTEISFTCPFCYSKHKKDGTPYKNAKRLVHYHSSGFNTDNRIEVREPHCYDNINQKEFVIYITDMTRRI